MKQRFKILLMLLFVVSTAIAQRPTKFGGGIRLYNATEVTDFGTFNGIPLVRSSDGLINNWIHSDSLVTQSQLTNGLNLFSEWSTYTGTRSNDLKLTIGDFDNSGQGTNIFVDDESGFITLKAPGTIRFRGSDYEFRDFNNDLKSTFVFPSFTQSNTVTWQDKSGTVAFLDDLLKDNGVVYYDNNTSGNKGVNFTVGYGNGTITFTNGSNLLVGNGTNFTNGSEPLELGYTWEAYVLVPNQGIKKVTMNNITTSTDAELFQIFGGVNFDVLEGTTWNYPTQEYIYYTTAPSRVEAYSFDFGVDNEINGYYNYGSGASNVINGNQNIYNGNNNVFTNSHFNIFSGASTLNNSSNNIISQGSGTLTNISRSIISGNNTLISDNGSSANFLLISGSNNTFIPNPPNPVTRVRVFGVNNKFGYGDSSLMGDGLTQNTAYETIIGRYNTTYTSINPGAWSPGTIGDRLFTLANGGDDLNRSDAFTVLRNAQFGIDIDNFETNTTGEKLQVNGLIKSDVTNAQITQPKHVITKEYFDANSGSGGATNLTYTPSPTNGTIASSTGTDAVINLADATNAGLMKANFYDEGSYTPTLDAQYTVSNTSSKYIRVGNKVSLTFNVNGISGNVTDGSPFTITLPSSLPIDTSSFSINAEINDFNTGSGGSSITLSNLGVTNSGGLSLVFYDNTNGLSGTSALNNLNFNSGFIRITLTYNTIVYTP